MRAISIVLIVAIALQTVGCSTWRPLVRANEVSEDNNPTSMLEQVLGKLKEGMAVRIRIRDGTRGPTKGEVIEGIIEKVGLTSLTVTTFTYYAPGNVSRELALHYSDIESIEIRKFDSEKTLVVLAAVSATAFFLLYWAFSGLEFD